MPPGPFSTARRGFVVSGSSASGQLAGPVGDRPAAVQVVEQLREQLHLCARGRVAGLRLLRHALVAALDVIAVCDEQLELERLEVVVRCRPVREPVEDGEDRVDLPEVAEQLRTGAGHVDDSDRRRGHLAGGDELGEPPEPPVGDRRHADVRLLADRRVRGDLRAGARQSVEQRRLAAVR